MTVAFHVHKREKGREFDRRTRMLQIDDSKADDDSVS